MIDRSQPGVESQLSSAAVLETASAPKSRRKGVRRDAAREE